MTIEHRYGPALHFVTFICCEHKYTNRKQAAQHLVKVHDMSRAQSQLEIDKLILPAQQKHPGYRSAKEGI